MNAVAPYEVPLHCLLISMGLITLFKKNPHNANAGFVRTTLPFVTSFLIDPYGRETKKPSTSLLWPIEDGSVLLNFSQYPAR
jgi:hypothetical protein